MLQAINVRLRLLSIAWLSLFLTQSHVAQAQQVDKLLRATEIARDMDEQELLDLVPLQSGLQYVGCPNCNSGRQERQLIWTIGRPDQVECRFCSHRYPSEKYPMQEAVVVDNPRGEPTRFEYWEDENGYRYFFKSRRDDEVRRYLARQTLKLAQLYKATSEREHARRAALVLDRFAQVFPGWCYHYDYPFRQKEIYDGDVPPEDFRSGFRTARWNWWAYHDIPNDLVEAYRLIQPSGIFELLTNERGTDVAKRIEHDLLRNAGEQVIANRDNCSNMSPSAWRSLIKLGRVVEEPRYIHEVVRRFRRLMEQKFFYDGYWYEGTPSYASATLSSLDQVLNELQGYSDPPDYVDPVDGKRFDELDLEHEFPLLAKARAAVERMRLPNGRFVPMHDTWAYTRRSEPIATAKSYLLPALGHACLVGGVGPQRSEFHFTWSGGYGHSHADMLSLLLFSHGRESLSDLGYTHTAYRSWAVATASHNAVVIDGLNQNHGSLKSPTDGSLRLIDLTNPDVQVVSADGTRAYPGFAKKYRRTVVVVDAGQQRRYAVDLFEVRGGKTHDYFLHGDADAPSEAMTNLDLKNLQTLLPTGLDWTPTNNEGQTGRSTEPHYAYGFLRNLRSALLPDDAAVPVEFQTLVQDNAGLRVFLCPETDSQLVLGENPSIRQAEEDDSQLDKHHRAFLMLRHLAKDGSSTFASVFEPYGEKPFIKSVQRSDLASGAQVLQIAFDNHSDAIVFNADREQSIEIGSDDHKNAEFQGSVGMLRLRDGKLIRAYALGKGGWNMTDFELNSVGSQRSNLIKIEPNSLIVTGADLLPPSPGGVVRLITADGWVYPFNVKSAAAENDGQSLRIEVAEGPGMEFDASTEQLRLTAYPQRQHDGVVCVEWHPSASWAENESK